MRQEKPTWRSGCVVLLALWGMACRTWAAVLPVPQCYQERDQWCWAASSQAVLAFYGTNVSQTEIAAYGTQGANIPNLLYGSASAPLRRGVDLILSRFRAMESLGLGYDLSLEEVQSEIETNGRPVVILWLWDSGGGHILVLHGLSGDYAYLMDPWNGPTISSFSWVQHGGGHQYVDTLQLVTPAGTLEAKPGSVEFGAVHVGFAEDRTLVLTNSGRGTICGSAFVASPFEVLSGAPYTIPERESRQVALRYRPSLPGNYLQPLTLTGGGGVAGVVSGYSVPLDFCGEPGSELLPVPVAVVGAVAVAGGRAHALALRTDGTLVAWGNNSNGQTNVPAGATQVIAIAAGAKHNLALRANGTVLAWGDNSCRQSEVPPGVSNIVAIAAGGKHSVALDFSGKVTAWGDDSEGQASVPPDLSNVIALAAGASHNLALKSDGQINAWGGNDHGQADVPIRTKPAVALAAGSAHSLVLDADGTVEAWGDNSCGQTDVPAAAQDIVAIAAAGNHSLALRRDGLVIAWGDNQFGQGEVPVFATNAVAVAAGETFNLVLEDDPALRPIVFLQPRSIGSIGFALPTLSRMTYYLEGNGSLDSVSWSTLDVVRGNGAARIFLQLAPDGTQRFYRIRAERITLQ